MTGWFVFSGIPVLKRRLKKRVVPSRNLPVRSFDRTSPLKLRSGKVRQRPTSALSQENLDTPIPCIKRPERLPEEAGTTSSPGGHAVFCDAAVQVHTAELTRPVKILDMIDSEAKLAEATGIQSYALLRALVSLCEARSDQGGDMASNIILTMLKVKHAVPFTLLSIMFGVSRRTAAIRFKATVGILASVLTAAVRWPELEEVHDNMPQCFKNYGNTRVIVDCTEVPLLRPMCRKCRQLTYSHYKLQHTVKVMIGVSPAGLVTFVSNLYGGRASDKAIYEQSGLHDLLEPHWDAVMADKGFLIDDICVKSCVQLHRPPILRVQGQLSKTDVLHCADVARARVHVERVKGCMKRFALLTNPVSMDLVGSLKAVLTVAAGLTNLANPVVGEIRL